VITLVHGDDSLASRKYFLSQKDDHSITFDSETISVVELAQSMQGSGLFEDSRKIFIENLFTRKGQKNLTSVADTLENTKNSEIYIWADKNVGVRSLGKFPKFENQNFKIPQNIWSFLDGIRPSNPRNINSFHNALKGTEPEIIFAMIIRQFRLLAGISSDDKQNAEEVKKLAPWQKSKLQKQASLFSQDKIKLIYKKLYKIEKGQKTGATNMTLTQNIDILLLEI